MENRIFFLSGLPRTGSTLLGSILNQNPDIYTPPTSPLYSLLVNTNEHFNLLNLQYTFDIDNISDIVYRGIIEAFYPTYRPHPIIFDKHRGWPKHVEAIKHFIDEEPRIVCTVRPISEILTSYIILADRDPDNFIDRHLKELGEPINNESRAHILWTHYLSTAYTTMKIGLECYPDNILLLEYDHLCYRPDSAIRDIYNFCDMELFEHDFNCIKNTCAEAKDEAWGLKDLHTIRRRLQKTSPNPLTILPQAAIDYFAQFDLTETAAW